MTTLDWAAVALYFVLVFVVAIVATRRGKTTESADGFFLAGCCCLDGSLCRSTCAAAWR